MLGESSWVSLMEKAVVSSCDWGCADAWLAVGSIASNLCLSLVAAQGLVFRAESLLPLGLHTSCPRSRENRQLCFSSFSQVVILLVDREIPRHRRRKELKGSDDLLPHWR